MKKSKSVLAPRLSMHLGRQCSAALSRYRVIAKIGDFLCFFSANLRSHQEIFLAQGFVGLEPVRRNRAGSSNQFPNIFNVGEPSWQLLHKSAHGLGQTRTSDRPDRVASPPWLEFDYWDLDLQSTLLALCLELGSCNLGICGMAALGFGISVA